MARIVDPRTGDDVRVGEKVKIPSATWEYRDGGLHPMPPRPDGWYCIDKLHDRFFTASADVTVKSNVDGIVRKARMPLIVRFMHPSFLFRRVIFVPS